MERVGKKAVIMFEAQSVRLLVTSDSDTVMQYSTLATAAVFETFRCESRSDNVIALEVQVANLLAGLKPAASPEPLTLKLTKRDEAQYLRAETRPRESEGKSASTLMVQDIPVRVISGQEMLRYAPPALPRPRVCLYLPPARVLCPVVERMKSLSKVLALEVESLASGVRLTLGVDHDLGHLRTMYNDLVCDAAAVEDPAAPPAARAAVALAEFSRTLRGIMGIATVLDVQVKLAILPGAALYLSIVLMNGTGEATVIHTVKVDAADLEPEAEANTSSSSSSSSSSRAQRSRDEEKGGLGGEEEAE